jgi:flavodoxin
MKAWVVYDSVYGNTEVIAQAIGDALSPLAQVEMLRVSQVKPELLAGLDLLIVGSPTQRFRPTPAVTQLLNGIPGNALKGVRVAAFDTRFTQGKIDETPVLAFFERIFGYAARPISDRLKKKGGELVVPPEGFYVEDLEGPLVEGELERAVSWTKEISAHCAAD